MLRASGRLAVISKSITGVGAGRRAGRAGHRIERGDGGQLEAGQVQPLGQRLDADRDVDQLTQPGHEHFHGVILW